MVDTLTQTVSQTNDIVIPLTVGSTGLTAALGKILWDIWKNPRSHPCQFHDAFVTDINAIKTDVAVIKNNIEWLVKESGKGE
jgi:hypothetical protein